MANFTPEQARAELARRQTRPPQITPEMARAELDRRQAQSPANKVATFARGVVEGVPIAGPLIHAASDRIGAAIQAGPMDWLSGETSDDISYDEALEQQQQKVATRAEANPIIDTVSQVGGSVLSTGGMAAPTVVGKTAAKIGAKALGLTGTGIPARVATAAASGVGIAGADTIARGNSEDALRNMAVGGTIAGAIPVVGSGLRKGYNAARGGAQKVLRPKDTALNQVSGALEADRAAGEVLDPSDIVAARQRGQNLTVGDVGGENMRGLARASGNLSPDARNAMRPLGKRVDAQHGKAVGFVSDIAGGKIDDLDYLDDLRASAAKANRPRYNKAYNAPGAQSLWDDEFAGLMQSDTFKKAARAATKRSGDRAALSGGAGTTKNPFVFANDGTVSMAEGVTPNLRFWDNVKRSLDDIRGSAARAGNKSFASDAGALRRALLEKLDNAVPEYSQARAGAAAAFGAEDALDAGRKGFNARMKNNELSRAFGALNSAEKEAFRIGYASELIDRLGTVGDRSNTINSVFRNPEAKAKFKIVLGVTRFKQLEAFIRVENAMNLLKTSVEGGSTTARQANEMIKWGAGGALIDPTTAIMSALGARGKQIVQNKISREIAEIIMSQDPAMVERLVQNAGSNRSVLFHIREIEKMIAAMSIGAGVGVAGVIPASEQQPSTPQDIGARR